MNPKDSGSLLKMVVLSIKSIDRRQVYRDVFTGDPYVDWEYVLSRTENVFGGNGPSLRMVHYLLFPDIEVKFQTMWRNGRDVPRSLALVHCFLHNLEAHHLVMTMSMGLRKLLLYNLAHLNGTSVLEQFSNRLLERATEDDILKVIACFAQQCFMLHDYNQAIVWILSNCVVATTFESEVNRFFQQREDMNNILRVRNVTINNGRPRLLDRLAQKRGARETYSVATGGGSASVLTGDGMDTFDGWCTRVRFPNTISSALKHRLYVTMSQPHVDHAKVVTKLQAQLLDKVMQNRITRPDVNVLANVIENLEMQMAPFQELSMFMRTCFRAFPHRNLREMTILKYMQLYLAAYQHPDLWKECWTQIYPLLSYQVIRDVEEFVKITPFNNEAFIQIISTM